ncbi:hypothetical protein BT67DRAFT_440752 [Trichocladium antarcticum]|uniref:MYND-type domain-containing protein n=1 Tax=Trichocladium antarcticum TaxID=1450529 RepID=A0AAN6ZFK8_9PEZI|nr:hypothetical protein BT67DRAFT_440752 [Trichocladium antarcticum]
MADHCTTCRKTPPEVNLKHCAKCSVTRYCSRDCQKANWKAHKKICGKGSSSGPGAPMPSKGLDQPIAKPFTALENGTWLHGRPEKDVYRLLVDAYRMRAEDDYTWEGKANPDGLYGGAENGLNGLRRFLGLAVARPGLLPPWFDAEKQRECEDFGMDSTQFQDLCSRVQKNDIIDHYGDTRFPMQLRMFAEAVYGRGPGGQNGATMRRAMASME